MDVSKGSEFMPAIFSKTLYGDGINDDSEAIQQMLDSGISAVYLPPPERIGTLHNPCLMKMHQSLQSIQLINALNAVKSDNC